MSQSNPNAHKVARLAIRSSSAPSQGAQKAFASAIVLNSAGSNGLAGNRSAYRAAHSCSWRWPATAQIRPQSPADKGGNISLTGLTIALLSSGCRVRCRIGRMQPGFCRVRHGNCFSRTTRDLIRYRTVGGGGSGLHLPRSSVVDVVGPARQLIAEVSAQPWGQISPSVYETGRLVTLAPWLVGHSERVEYLLSGQHRDGSWGGSDGYALVPTLS